MAARIFISHSTWVKDTEDGAPGQPLQPDHDFLQALCQRLRDDGFEPLIDAELVRVGQPWRELLFGELGSCNGAVIVLNEQALQDSAWVDTEAKVLCWRAWVERPEFPVVIVRLGALDLEAVRAHPEWEPIAATELQMLPQGGGAGVDCGDAAAATAIMNQVVDALAAAPDAGESSTPADRIREYLAEPLGQLKDPKLKLIATKLGVDGAAALPRAALQRRIADAMYAAGPAALETVLDHAGAKRDDMDVARCLELLGTAWVDLTASGSIWRFASRDATCRVFAINGDKLRFTPKAYVRQLSCWRHMPVICVSTKDPRPEAAVAQVRGELRKKFGRTLEKRLGTLDDIADVDLDAAINRLLGERLHRRAGDATPPPSPDTPAFVALPPQGSRDPALLQAIHTTYPDLAIVLLTASAPGGAGIAGVETLLPELDLDREADAESEYHRIDSIL